LTFLVVIITLTATEPDTPDTAHIENTAPLSIADIFHTEIDDDMTENRLNETLLLGHREVYERQSGFTINSDGIDITPDLKYEIVSVKASFLYDWCKEQMYYEQDETYSDWPVGNRMVYREQDPRAWGAEEVYRLCISEQYEGHFL
jgi:hypothetical protein